MLFRRTNLHGNLAWTRSFGNLTYEAVIRLGGAENIVILGFGDRSICRFEWIFQ